MLASEYGWAKRDILEDTYLDELFMLIKEINKRKLVDWKMQLAIVQNPYTKKPKELWDTLKSQEEREENVEFDQIGLGRLKEQLSQNPRFVVK